MRKLYIVHSTFWVKMMVWFFATFTLSDIKKKIHHLSGVGYLCATILSLSPPTNW